MKKSVLILLTLASAVSTTSAGAWVRGENDMLKAATEGLRLVNPAIQCAPEKLFDGEMLAVYGARTGGYVVVSRSGVSSPVIGYSADSFDIANLPDGLAWWLEQADRNMSERERIVNVNAAPEASVGPLLTTAWGQDRPYNNLCPSTGGFWGTTASQTGCVATAMAQVLRFFKHPAVSTGKGAYSTDGENFKEVTMSTEYKWDKMRDRYTFGYSDEEAQAVAELMRDCGYASRMVYTTQGSGANLYDAAHGAITNMKYEPLSLRVLTRAYVPENVWLETVTAELSAGRPILYTGVDRERMGHAFVFDGLDTRGFVHVNWGWEGSANGYFDLSAVAGLNPSYMDPYVGSEIKYDFSDEQLMVLGFNPSSEPLPGAEYESLFVCGNVPELEFKDDSLLISPTATFNFSALDFKGLLGLVVEGEDGHAVVQPFFYSGWEDGLAIPVTGGMMITEEYYPSATLNDTDGKTPRPDGKYRFYFVSWAEEEMEGGINPRSFHYPVALIPDGDAVWECVKTGGHWNPSTLRLADKDTNIEKVEIQEESGMQDGTYTLDGIRLPEGTSLTSLRAGVPVVVRQGGRTFKVLPR